MKHLKRFNEENIFKRIFRSSTENSVAKICKELGLNYDKIKAITGMDPYEDESYQIGPKNGHEIKVTFKEFTTGDSIGDHISRQHGADSLITIVRPSYYGTFYEKEKQVDDLKEYLSNYDFNFKPKVTHKYSVTESNNVKVGDSIELVNNTNIDGDYKVTSKVQKVYPDGSILTDDNGHGVIARYGEEGYDAWVVVEDNPEGNLEQFGLRGPSPSRASDIMDDIRADIDNMPVDEVNDYLNSIINHCKKILKNY